MWLVAARAQIGGCGSGPPARYGTYDSEEEALRVHDLALELIQAFENPEGRVPVEGSECDAMLEKHKTLKACQKALNEVGRRMWLVCTGTPCQAGGCGECA